MKDREKLWEYLKLLTVLQKCPFDKMIKCFWMRQENHCHFDLKWTNIQSGKKKEYYGECPFLKLREELSPEFRDFWKTFIKDLSGFRKERFWQTSLEIVVMIGSDQIFCSEDFLERFTKDTLSKLNPEELINSIRERAKTLGFYCWVSDILEKIKFTKELVFLAVVLEGTKLPEFRQELFDEIESFLDQQRKD